MLCATRKHVAQPDRANVAAVALRRLNRTSPKKSEVDLSKSLKINEMHFARHI